MRYARDPNEFTRRNVKAGRKTANIGDRRRAELAESLQGVKNQGYANVANIRSEGAQNVAGIRQEGFDRRLASSQKYGLPLQQANTETAQLGNEGTEFYQELIEPFGEDFMRKALGRLPKEAELNPMPDMASLYEDIRMPLTGPKTDISRLGGGASGSWEEEEEGPSLLQRFSDMFRKKKKTASTGVYGAVRA